MGHRKMLKDVAVITLLHSEMPVVCKILIKIWKCFWYKNKTECYAQSV